VLPRNRNKNKGNETMATTQTATQTKETTDFGSENFELIFEGHILTIRTDLSRVMKQTASGNDRICSSLGNRVIDPQGTKLGLNIFRAPSAKK